MVNCCYVLVMTGTIVPSFLELTLTRGNPVRDLVPGAAVVVVTVVTVAVVAEAAVAVVVAAEEEGEADMFCIVK
jgi:hypothetical protein